MYAYTTPPACPSATADHPFSVQNLPFGIFSTAGTSPRVGVALGDYIIDLSTLKDTLCAGVEGLQAVDVTSGSLNSLMGRERKVWKGLRAALTALATGATSGLTADNLVAQSDATMHLPADIGDYTDFYSSREVRMRDCVVHAAHRSHPVADHFDPRGSTVRSTPRRLSADPNPSSLCRSTPLTLAPCSAVPIMPSSPTGSTYPWDIMGGRAVCTWTGATLSGLRGSCRRTRRTRRRDRSGGLAR